MSDESISTILQRIREWIPEAYAPWVTVEEIETALARLAVVREHAEAIRDRHRIDIHDAIRDGVANCNRCDHSHPCPDWQHAEAILREIGEKDDTRQG